jgi:hypothetical protein
LFPHLPAIMIRYMLDVTTLADGTSHDRHRRGGSTRE